MLLKIEGFKDFAKASMNTHTEACKKWVEKIISGEDEEVFLIIFANQLI